MCSPPSGPRRCFGRARSAALLGSLFLVPRPPVAAAPDPRPSQPRGSQESGPSALEVGIGHPSTVAVDGKGNVYVGVPDAQCVLRVDPAGQVTVVGREGSGPRRFVPEMIPSLPVAPLPFSRPVALAPARDGALYVLDGKDGVVRRVSAAGGAVTTIGAPRPEGREGSSPLSPTSRFVQPRGLALDADGWLYIADAGAHRVVRVRADGDGASPEPVAGSGTPGYTGDGGPATEAHLASPHGLALDRLGALYLADRANHCIRRVDPRTGVITTVAGTGFPGASGDGGPARAAQLRDPAAVAVDGDGALFIADLGNSRVRRVDPRTGIITTAQGLDKVASSGLAVAADGTLFVGDLEHRTVLRMQRKEGPRIIVGNGGLGYGGDGRAARAAFLSGPRGLARDRRGNLYVAEAQAHRVRRIDGASGLITTVAGNGIAGYSGDGGPATKASLNEPQGIALDGAGNLLIADMGNHRVRKLASDGTITTIAGTGRDGLGGDGLSLRETDLGRPSDVAFDRKGGILVVLGGPGLVYRVDPDSGKVRRLVGLPVERTLLADGQPATSGRIDHISAFAVTPEGDLLFAEEGSLRIRRVDATTGLVRTVAGRGLKGPTEPPNRALGVSLANVTSLAVDPTGNTYVGEYGIGIRKIDAATQEVTLVVPASSHVDATGLLFSPPDGLYIADRAGFLRRLGPDGSFVIEAGGGFGF